MELGPVLSCSVGGFTSPFRRRTPTLFLNCCWQMSLSGRSLWRSHLRPSQERFRNSPRPGAIYLNVGHTGLNEPSLPRWIERHRLRAVYLIHDLIPLTHPQFCRAGESEKHERRMSNVLASAAGVIGNSQVTIDGLAAFARGQGKPMPPSVSAWLGGADFPLNATPDTLRNRTSSLSAPSRAGKTISSC